jgi:zinc finger protein
MSDDVRHSEEAKAEQHVADGSAGVEQNYIRAELGEMTDIESMCPACQENGRTRLMITMIPHFREVIVSSFDCDHCGESNRLVQFGGEYGPKKVKFELKVKNAKDLNRQVVKADFATVSIPELELELGPEAQKGTLNTVEGILQQVKDGLEFQQPLRQVQDPELHDKIAKFIERLEEYKSGAKPFTLWLEDPAGNSYIEAIYADEHSLVDHQLVRFEVTRSEEERRLIGIQGEGAHNTMRTEEEEARVERGEEDGVSEFWQPCPACGVDGSVKVHQTTIPFFGRIVIMAYKCDACGYKSNEVKDSGEMKDLGRRITLRVENESDMSRDVLKSNTTRLIIPEIELEMAPGTLGGFFTTVEGVMSQVHEALATLRQTSFDSGDSATIETNTTGGGKMRRFLAQLAELRDGKKYPFTLILEDPVGLVYIQNPRSHLPPPENEDPQMKVEDYERTAEENEDLGLA